MSGNNRSGLMFSNPTWVLKVIFHVAILFCAFIIAYELRRGVPLDWWVNNPDAWRVVKWSLLYALVGGGVEIVFQTERTAWRYVSAHEVVALARNVVLTLATFVLCLFIMDRGFLLPRSVPIIAGLLSLLILVGARLAWRVRHNLGLAQSLLPTWWTKQTSNRTPILVVGSMEDADRHLRNLLGDTASPYAPVGLISPRPQDVGLRVQGVPVIGAIETWDAGKILSSIGRSSSGAILFLQDPVQTLGLTVEQIGELRREGYSLLRPQSLTEFGSDGAGESLKEIPVEEFLPRKPISLPLEPVRNLIAGRRVLVTGAGGSIGSEIARQLVSLGCAHLTLLDHSEFHLFEIDREISAMRSKSTRTAILANVRDRARIAEVFRTERPQIVFHAAALKHVGLVEINPAEGVLTNVQGTWNAICAAIDSGAEQFVLISTDKAVAPTNVMGATKRVAESLLDLAPAGATRLSAVRFGNVLGSAGSVVPIFRDQIARGGPVTVTHPDVDRFFMTIPEAVQLVLHSTAVKATQQGIGPSKFLLEMGAPVKIADLAKQMIELSGKRPGVDIEIRFTGLQPGEKLSEVLSDEGETVVPCVEGIMEVVVGEGRKHIDELVLQDLIESARSADREGLATRLGALIQHIRSS